MNWTDVLLDASGSETLEDLPFPLDITFTIPYQPLIIHNKRTDRALQDDKFSWLAKVGQWVMR